jgi:hypothetical protein
MKDLGVFGVFVGLRSEFSSEMREDIPSDEMGSVSYALFGILIEV